MYLFICSSLLFYTLHILICTAILVCGGIYFQFNGSVNYSDSHSYVIVTSNYEAETFELQIESFDGSKDERLTMDSTPDTINQFTTTEKQFSTDALLKHKPSHGYVLPYQIYEQQTAAAQNLWGLQYWANTVKMKVVEPFIGSHTMSFEPIVMGTINPMRFSDLYDREFWNNQSMLRHCSGLVEWEEFLENAPRQTILAIVYNDYGRKPANVSDYEAVTNPDSIIGEQTCNYTTITFPETALTYFRKLEFQFVRKVCINMHNPTKINELSQYILSHYNSSNVTIIFPGWSGIRHNKLNVQGISFNGANTVSIGLLPSIKILQDSEKYLKKLRPNGGKYFGVIVRTENMYTRTVKSGKFDHNLFFDYMLGCSSNLSRIVFQKHDNWGRTLAIDLGRLGSVKFLKGTFMKNDQNKKILYNSFFTSVFGQNWTIEEYERSFKKYLDIDDPAYVAQIQRTIAAKSDCLVMVGGESLFQKATITFYKRFHPNPKEQCIIYHCYYPVNFNLRKFHTLKH